MKISTVREMLDMIDEFLSRCTQESGNLWDVLTALRGPDNEDLNLKADTTGPIRRAAFPRLVEALDNSFSWVSGPSCKYPGDMDGSEFLRHGDHSHFDRHATGAAKVLGLLP